MNVHNFNTDLISEELVFKFNEYFNEYKVYMKNYITFESLIHIITDYGYIPSQFEIDDVKSEVGSNIDKIYFMVIMARIVRKMREKETIDELKECFKTIDFDKNGTIEKDELYKIIKCYIKNPPSKDYIDLLFTEIDLNDDNHITFDEFTKFLHDF
tara:strand:+ start:304 stop:771 length:468 start_codon:yes stop_codon:yes gene_type:complete